MASEALNKYIEKRYDRWLDYAKYICSLSSMSGEEIDVLNEVLITILEKADAETDRMLETKRGKYTELDYYIIGSIKLNATSDTAPYRHKYKSLPIDDNVDWCRLNIVDEEDDEKEDKKQYVLDRFQEVRQIIESLGLSEKAIKVFTWKFFAGESFADWPEKESKKELYAVYKRVFKTILDKKAGNLFF